MPRRPRTENGLARLLPVKGLLHAESRRAADTVRSCEGCDARCCRVGLNSMRVSRLEARVLADRLAEPDLAPRREEILSRAEEEVRRRGLDQNPDATYDCPLLSPEGRCLVHGPAQPAGCLTFMPVADGGCDHDLPLFGKHERSIHAANCKAYGRASDPLPIPVALLRRRPAPRR